MTTAAIDRRNQGRLRRPAPTASFLHPLLGLLVIQRIFFPAPLGIVFNGALVGGRIALIALGIALIYRANRIVNFAQGDLGAVPATLGVMLVVAWGWSYWFGLAVGLAGSILLGVLVETLIIRRFFTAPRLLLTVATIGLAQVLAGAALFIPRPSGQQLRHPPDPAVQRPPFRIDPVTFNANDIFTMILVPACLVALALFLQRSKVGVAIVGAAERADRAFTLGIPVKRLHTVVWVVASVLAFLAMYLRAGAVGLPIGQVLPMTFLVQALAAAVLGPVRAVRDHRRRRHRARHRRPVDDVPGRARPAYNDAVLFVIVLAGLLLVRRPGPAGSTPTPRRPGRPPGRSARSRRRCGAARGRVGRALLWAVIAAFVLTLPTWLSTSRINLATIIVIFGIVAASLVVLTGWAGQVSLGQMAFVGSARRGRRAHRPARLGHGARHGLVAGAVGAVAAVVVGYPALRRRGLTLAVSTLAFGLFVSSYLLNRTVYPIHFLGFEIPDWLPSRRFDRGTMLGIDASSETAMFYIALAVLALSLLMVVGWRRSRTGRVLIAIRENEKAALAYGVNVTRTSLAAFAFSGFLAAIAGVLYVQHANGPQRRPLPAPAEPRAVHDGGHRRPRLAAGSPPRCGVRPGRRLLPAGRVAVPGHRRRPAVGAAADAERLRRRAGRRARRRPAPHRPAPGPGGAQPAGRRACRGAAEAPPEEDVLAAAGELAEEAQEEVVLAEAAGKRRGGRGGRRATAAHADHVDGNGADGDAVEARR